jgi:hypothetical protein
MIDYEKLEEAHALAQKISNHSGLSVYLQVQFRDKLPLFNCHFDGKPGLRMIHSSLDEIIAELKELTKPEPKYEIGEKVYFFDQIERHGIDSGYINGKFHDEDGYSYEVSNKHDLYLEDKLYPTRQALIHSQLEYWHKLKLEIEFRLDDKYIQGDE